MTKRRSSGERPARRPAWRDRRPDLERLIDRIRKKGLREPQKLGIAELIAEFPQRTQHIEEQVQRAMTAWERGQETARRRRKGMALSTVNASGEHRLHMLPPAPRWTVIIDETGSHFERDPSNNRRDLPGRFVAIAGHEDMNVPAIEPGWHAADAPLEEIDRITQQALDTPFGIFGMNMHDVPATTDGDRWISGIAEVMHWVLRLLNVPDTGNLHVEFFVEQRWEPYHNGYSLTDYVEEIRRQLELTDPQRYKRMTVSAIVITKDAHPWNGYVDAIAFTWGSPAAASKERRLRSGLIGTCLMDDVPDTLRQAWDELRADAQLDPVTWRRLVGLRYHEEPGSIAAGILANLGLAAQNNPGLWQQYVEQAELHMESKKLSLDAFRAQMDWLATWMPDSARFSRHTELRWLIARMAVQTHLGFELGEEAHLVETLSDELFEEFPREVCELQLRRAVALTNVFRFHDARLALQTWLTQPVAVPGLRQWARVLSSLGQHDAFEGRLQTAVQYFDRAISGFERMSDPLARAGEIAQTSTYRCIALMDDSENVSDQVARRALLAHLGVDDLPDAIRTWGVDGSGERPVSVWSVYLIHRWLLHRGTSGDRGAWATSAWPPAPETYAHPWPLIRFYRALLLRNEDSAQARALLNEAVADATLPEHGPVLHMMGLMFQTFGYRLGLLNERPSAYLHKTLLRQMPAAAPWLENIKAMPSLRNASDESLAIMLGRCMPFNFR